MISNDASYMAIYKHPLLLVYAPLSPSRPIDESKRSGSLGEDAHYAEA